MKYRLDDIVTINNNSIKKEYFGAIDYLDTSSVFENSFDQPVHFNTSKEAPSRAKRLACIGDTVISTVRPNMHHLGFIDEKLVNSVFSTGFAIVEPNTDLVDPYYLFLFLSSDVVTRELQSIGENSTSTYPSIKPSDIKKLIIDLPKLNEQRRISKRIKCFEDKIKLNSQINDNLLELARTYYQSIIDTRDKEKQMISNIADSVVTGKTPSTKDESNYGYDVPFITIPDMHSQVFTTQTARYLSKKGADSQIKKYLPPYTLSVSSIGTPGLVTINPVEAQTNQQINSIIAEKEKIWYLFLAFDSLKKYIKNMGSGGSTILNLNKSNFKKIEIDWPSNNDTLVEINKFLDPIFMSILNNQQEIDNLVIIRDYLLSELL